MDSSDDYAGERELKCFSDGRIVQTTDGDLPYKAILTHDHRGEGSVRLPQCARLKPSFDGIRRAQGHATSPGITGAHEEDKVVAREFEGRIALVPGAGSGI